METRFNKAPAERFIEAGKRKKDARVTGLRLTERRYDFWKKTDPKDTVFRKKMFKEMRMSKKDIAVTRNLLKNAVKFNRN